MTRLGIVVALIGFLLADPVLCRAVDAQGPCPGGQCGAVHGLLSEQGHQPFDACQEAVHGCLCQGATNDPAAGQRAELLTSSRGILSPQSPWLDRLALLLKPVSITPSPGAADGLSVGRSLRIAIQSFQI